MPFEQGLEKLYGTYIGVVVDRRDPNLTGRVRVRVLNVHSMDKNELPTADLPWAIVLKTGSMFQAPETGKVVMVQFTDGDSNYPNVIGIADGVRFDGDPFGTLGYEKQQFGNVLPSWPEGTVRFKPDEPSVPRCSRGDITGTPIEIANNAKEHACEISYGTKLSIARARLEGLTFIKKIRDAIKAFFTASSENSLLSSIQQKIKQFLEWIKKLIKEMKIIQDILVAVNIVTNKLKEMIAYILTLPARLLKAASDCISQFMSDLNDALSDTFSEANGLNMVSDVQKVVDSSQRAVQTAQETYAAAEETANNVEDLANKVERV